MNTSQTTNKATTWQKHTDRLSHLTDNLGMTIDPGILGLVIALNALGFPTCGSCEGHPEEMEQTPYVDLEIQVSLIDQKQAIEALQEAERQGAFQILAVGEIQQLREHANQLYQQLDEPALRLRQRLSLLLQRFYQEHDALYEDRLTLTSLRSFGCIQQLRLASQGAEHVSLLSASEYASTLVAYQSEMQQFTDFLQRWYWTHEETTTL